ncbi:MAG: hypothetical protein AABX11_05065 [Nanoarchaeota archaeon]
MSKRHSAQQRLSHHLRFGGDRQWSSGGLVGSEVQLNDTFRGKCITGRLVYTPSGFFINGQHIGLRGIQEVMPQEKVITYDSRYSTTAREIPRTGWRRRLVRGVY